MLASRGYQVCAQLQNQELRSTLRFIPRKPKKELRQQARKAAESSSVLTIESRASATVEEMKRDLDLVRTILRSIEEAPAGEVISGFQIEGHDEIEIGEHLRLLIDAGFIKGEASRTRSGYLLGIRGLTWNGHEFLDAARSDSLWALAKEKVIKPLGGVALDVLFAWLKAESKKQLGLTEPK